LANLQRGEYLEFTGAEQNRARHAVEGSLSNHYMESPIGHLGYPVLRTVTKVGDDLKGKNISLVPTRGTTANYLHIGHFLPTLPIPSTPCPSIAEIIVFDRILSPVERQKIESYLALKFGISLNQNAPRHYLDNHGHPIWNATLHEDYKYHIAGLGSDSIANWQQIQANSNTPSGQMINISHPHTNGSMRLQANYFTFSDNNLPTDLQQSPDQLNNRPSLLQRKWTAQRTGFEELQLNIAINTRQLFATLPTNQLWLLAIDSSGLGTFSPATTSFHPVSQLGPSGKAKWNNIPWPTQEHVHFTLATEWRPPHQEASLDAIFQTVVLSPNPSTDGHFQLRVSLKEEHPLNITAFDANGRAVWQQKSPSDTHHQSTGYLPKSGVYHFQVQAADHATSASLIVQ